MSLPHGGHLTHGWKVTISGRFFNAVQYGVRREDQRIDMDSVAALAKEHKPKLIICGASAYPRLVDFAAFAEIARDVGAYLLADIAHISGLVAGGVHPSPVGHADVISTTTHKTLRGPRGGMIMCTEALAKQIDRAVFPGLQGGPHNHTTAALAVALKEALQPEFKTYAQAVVDNASTLAERLLSHGYDLVSGGTENHLILMDLTAQNVPGKVAAKALETAGIVCNANSVPFDPRKPFDPSGIRIGTPAITSRGMGSEEMNALGDWMHAVLSEPDNVQLHEGIAGEVKACVCSTRPRVSRAGLAPEGRATALRLSLGCTRRPKASCPHLPRRTITAATTTPSASSTATRLVTRLSLTRTLLSLVSPRRTASFALRTTGSTTIIAGPSVAKKVDSRTHLGDSFFVFIGHLRQTFHLASFFRRSLFFCSSVAISASSSLKMPPIATLQLSQRTA